MSMLDTCRKQAKLLVRWHREGNYSVASRIRTLQRHALLTDQQALAHPFTLAEAQEIIAREAGYHNWAELKGACSATRPEPHAAPPLHISAAVPVLFVTDVARSAAFYSETLGFAVDFLHGHPPFYGSVSRDGARLHLKWIYEPVFGPGRVEAEGLIMAFLAVENVKALYAEFTDAGLAFRQKLTKQPWGGSDFHIGDPDGNVIAFAS
jgi:uncharacterized glyoxalase superfamily protein PhnB